MERQDLPRPNTPSAERPGAPEGRIPAPAPAGSDERDPEDSPVHRLVTPILSIAAGATDERFGGERLSRLSVHEFCDRISLLAELELPCSVYIANPSAEQISRGVVRKIEREADRLNLFGDGFSLHLHQNNIDSIWLVNNSSDDQGIAIEIHNRTGSLIARLFGMQDSIGAAVWQDVMGNPSFAVA